MAIQSQAEHEKAGTFYEEGLAHFQKNNFQQAHQFFKKAFACRPEGKLLTAVQSYFGYTLATIENRDREGFRLLHEALRQEFYRPDYFMNLGKAHLAKNQRKQALNALYNGLKVSPNDPEISRLLLEIGTRRRPVIKFLSRDHFLNVWLGKRRLSRTKKTLPASRVAGPSSRRGL